MMMVYTQEWMMYSSTNSRTVGAYFRIRNRSSSAINWRTVHWYSSYSGAYSCEQFHSLYSPCHIVLPTTWAVPCVRRAQSFC